MTLTFHTAFHFEKFQILLSILKFFFQNGVQYQCDHCQPLYPDVRRNPNCNKLNSSLGPSNTYPSEAGGGICTIPHVFIVPVRPIQQLSWYSNIVDWWMPDRCKVGWLSLSFDYFYTHIFLLSLFSIKDTF